MSSSKPGPQPESAHPRAETRPKIVLVPNEAVEAPPPEAAVIHQPAQRFSMPTTTEMASLMKSAEGSMDDMARIRTLAVAWAAAGTEAKLPRDRLREAFEFKIDVECEIGMLLLEVDHRGGLGSKSENGTSIRGGSSNGLPRFMDKRQADLYRSMARARKHRAAYYAQQEGSGRLPKSNGLVAFAAIAEGQAAPAKTSHRLRRTAGAAERVALPIDESIWVSVWHAVSPLLKIDLVVGLDPDLVKAQQGVDMAALRPNYLKGTILVKADDRVDEWLNHLHDAKRAGQVKAALIAFRASPGEPWFRLLDDQGWMCCFLRGSDPLAVVAFLGDHPRPLAWALHRLGAVLRGCQTQDIVQ